MKYIISYQKPHNHYVDIEFVIDNIEQDIIEVQLPAWRPGRYELANFAKNIQKWAAYDEKGNVLESAKIKKDCWEIQTKSVSQVHIKYNYYAAEMNAGSTYLDASQLYMNPVNCCLYVSSRMDEQCEMELKLPNDYNVAIGVEPRSSKNNFLFNSFHELVDSPFIASSSLQKDSFKIDDVEFNLWFQGECKPDWKKLKSDFFKFAKEQLDMMSAFPVKKYHFLFQILPYKTYHGVEHITSTVISLGPGYNLMNDSMYEDLLGVSCHELFHVWNVKTIRPVEMQPYDYAAENYSKLGYVAEGVTTYYGDYLLFRSGVYSEGQYLKTLNTTLQRHFDNFGRFNLSVADSSYDTWLDGYVKGAPNRKTSIYNEGCLLAFVADLFIRKNSDNKNSLDDVMRFLYNEFALKRKGYSDSDYKGVVENFANTSFGEIFDKHINAAADYQLLLIDAMDYIGCELSFKSATNFCEHAIGVKISALSGSCKVVAVYPDSVADISGLSLEDEIIAVNSMQVEKGAGALSSFNGWCNYYGEAEKVFELTVASQGIIKSIVMAPIPNKYFKTVEMKKNSSASINQKANFEVWSKNKF